jgi:hypothetical protein
MPSTPPSPYGLRLLGDGHGTRAWSVRAGRYVPGTTSTTLSLVVDRKAGAGHGADDGGATVVMDLSFWIGLLAGVVTSGIAWYVPVRVLVPKIRVGDIRLVRLEDGSMSYRFDVENVGRRDMVDASVSCTLYSLGWGNRDGSIWATIGIPTTVGHINVVPGKGFPWSRPSPLRDIGARVITLRHDAISGFQSRNLSPEQRQQLANKTMTLTEMFELGDRSFINVTVYGSDSFSGTRSVFTGRVFKHEDLPTE